MAGFETKINFPQFLRAAQAKVALLLGRNRLTESNAASWLRTTTFFQRNTAF
jgi:hypothetical protein